MLIMPTLAPSSAGSVPSSSWLLSWSDRSVDDLVDGLVPLVEPPGDEQPALPAGGVGGVLPAVLQVLLLQSLEVRAQLVEHTW